MNIDERIKRDVEAEMRVICVRLITNMLNEFEEESRKIILQVVESIQKKEIT